MKAHNSIWKNRRSLFWVLSMPFLLPLILWLPPFGLRTTDSMLGWWVKLVGLSGPCAMFFLSFIFRTTAWLIVVRIILVLVALYTMFLLVIFTFVGKPEYSHTDQDPGFEPLHEVRLRSERIRLYRTNGGATTSYGIVVRKEAALFGSFYRAENLYSNGRRMSAHLTLSADSTRLFVVDTIHRVDTLAVIDLQR